MSFVNIWIHAIWSTKNKMPWLTRDLKSVLFSQMMDIAAANHLYIDCINGASDHLHCLVCMNANQFVDQVIRQIKMQSECWINENKLAPVKFEWEDGYYAVSIGESGLHDMRRSIREQDKIHQDKSHSKEMEELIMNQGLYRMQNFDLNPLSWAEKTFFQYAE